MEFLGSFIEFYCRRSVDMNPSLILIATNPIITRTRAILCKSYEIEVNSIVLVPGIYTPCLYVINGMVKTQCRRQPYHLFTRIYARTTCYAVVVFPANRHCLQVSLLQCGLLQPDILCCKQYTHNVELVFYSSLLHYNVGIHSYTLSVPKLLLFLP
jgi:hypothetical protein